MLRSRCAVALSLVLGGCSTDSCFVAGTKVATPSGPRPIEQLQVGDEVLAFVPETGGTVVRQVLRTLRRTVQRTRTLTFADRTLITTDEHPFYDAEGKRWVPAAELAAPHVLVALGEHGTRPLHAPRFELSFVPTEVFNLSVGGPEQTYFAEGVAVHNKSMIEPLRPVTLRNETNTTVKLELLRSNDECFADLLWTPDAVHIPVDLAQTTGRSVNVGAGQSARSEFFDPYSDSLCRFDTDSGQRARGGVWLGLGDATYVALGSTGELLLRVTEAGALVGEGSTTVVPVKPLPLCTDTSQREALRPLLASRTGSLPTGGVIESSTANAEGCLTVILSPDGGGPAELDVCVPEDNWPFAKGDAVTLQDVGQGVRVQSRTDTRRIDLLDGPFSQVDAVRVPEPACIEPASMVQCEGRRMNLEVSIAGRWVRPGEPVVSGERTDIVVHASALALHAGCDPNPRERLQLVRVTR